jgi:iron complex transport system substrate-binding protein
MRVISLLPSATELLCLAGGRDLLVGRSHECDFPGGLDDVPVLTRPHAAFDPAEGRDAGEVDRLVREAMDAGRPLCALDTGMLADLMPDLILTQDVCHVCSIDVATVRTIARHMRDAFGREPLVVSLNAQTVEGMLDDLLTVGNAIKRPEVASKVVVDLRTRLFRAEEYVNPYEEGPVVGFLEWTDPLYVAGHWTVQLIERAGGRHPLNETVAKPDAGAAVGPQRGERVAGKSIAVSPEVFAATRPGAVIVAPCGLTLDEADAETRKLLGQEWFGSLPAVEAGRVVAVDGNQMFNRPGPRLIDAFEWMVGWLQGRPELIPEGFPWRVVARDYGGIGSDLR